MARMRAFVAVSVPPEVTDVLAALDRPTFDDVRWTTPEQWHVTLRFLGEVPDVGPVRDALASVPTLVAPAPGPRSQGPADGDPGDPGEPDPGGVDATLGPVTAWFPGRRVLHVPVLGLEALADAAEAALAALSIPAEPGPRRAAGDEHRPFSGHLTLARVRGRRPGPARLAGMPVSATWPVDRFSLMGSTLGPGGSRYETVATYSLHV